MLREYVKPFAGVISIKLNETVAGNSGYNLSMEANFISPGETCQDYLTSQTSYGPYTNYERLDLVYTDIYNKCLAQCIKNYDGTNFDIITAEAMSMQETIISICR